MKDNFSGHAANYAKYRPAYPTELFDFILQQFSERNAAWDCATGNGQTAKELSGHFVQVFATDASQKQLDHAEQRDNIYYSVQPAEKTNFTDAQFDLVTVSQALHWFRFDDFYREVRRVTKPGGWLAVWMYGLLRVSPAIDELIDEYHYSTLEKYWDPERRYVDENYRTIPFPFNEIGCPAFYIRYTWTLDELEGYLTTWSALQKFISANQYNPVADLVKRIKPHWTGDSMDILFPLHIRMGRR